MVFSEEFNFPDTEFSWSYCDGDMGSGDGNGSNGGNTRADWL